MSERRVWKYEFEVNDKVEIDLPAGAQILCVNSQGPLSMACIWALVDPSASTERVTFRVLGTGHPIQVEELRCYIGTWFAGPLVFHLFHGRSAQK